MKCGRAQSRILALLLILNLVHAPFPICDGDDALLSDGVRSLCEHQQANTTFAEPSIELERPDWDLDIPPIGDVDFIFLGLDPPEDPDEGPFDSTPESERTSYFPSSSTIKPSTGRHAVPVGRLKLADLAGLSLPEGWRDCSLLGGLRSRVCAYGTTFADPQCWRMLLSVSTC